MHFFVSKMKTKTWKNKCSFRPLNTKQEYDKKREGYGKIF